MVKIFSTEHLNSVFSAEDKYEGFINLAFDLLNGREMYDEDDREISPATANDKIRKVVFEVLGIDKNSTKKERKRAMKRHGLELFEVIEEIIDVKISTGFHDTEIWNRFVDSRNLKDSDSQEFWTDDKTILATAKVSGDHHDLIIQRLGEGESYTVSTSTYAVKIGTDIDLFLTGRIDWNKLVDKISQAFVAQIQNEIYAEIMNVGTKIPVPSQFAKTMELNATNKDAFDTLIEDVATANDNVPVYIMGTKTALKKLNKLADVDWITDGMKDDVATMGRLGSYEGVTLVEIPQRFALNDTSKKLVDSTKLLIMPQVDNKFVKFVDVGETEIVEAGQNKGDKMDDIMTYEVQRTMGIGVQCGRYFGVWTISG